MKKEITLKLTDYQIEILLAIIDEKANSYDDHSTKSDTRAIALDDIAKQIETQ